MTPFDTYTRDSMRREAGWKCASCGKSSFDTEKWLLDAAHNVHRNDSEGGEVLDRICHFLKDVDMGDLKSANRIANRIWNSGLRHFSEYERDPSLMKEDRLQFSEMLSALGLEGKIHIKEVVTNVRELRDYVNKNMARVRR